ncbi:hypothetical protein [Novosphingobium sp. JCM 18896]|uniref:hypothetical protein n=1 Tax=Novosphingobium sp. JCM 18896 TaxID=2989731 RepID=UPI002222DC27|nr:hypothetical protein [Novosphingobium sp. JCM 18896]MCW1432118.1 hypothetical protein [Novosphingobium sp. JCM 18896]
MLTLALALTACGDKTEEPAPAQTRSQADILSRANPPVGFSEQYEDEKQECEKLKDPNKKALCISEAQARLHERDAVKMKSPVKP